MAHSTRSCSSFARCVYVTKHTSAHFEILQESSKSSKGQAASPPPILQVHLKRLQGVMLISVCQGTFNGASAFLSRCNTNCKLHSDEGDGRLPFLLSRAVCAFVRCYCLRVGALARCLRLFICRLRGFYCFCNTLHTLHAFARLCGFSCSRIK